MPCPNVSLTAANLKAPKNGYAYVYVSNESQEPVYFDNLQVAHTRGRIAEETHYYSYGLQIAAISSKKVGDPREGTLDNRYGYNDKELWDDADLNWLDYGFRNYDPQIGRFVQLDPLTDFYPEYSPYQYAGLEPIANVDIDGLEPLGALTATTTMVANSMAPFTKTIGMVTVTAVKAIKPSATALSVTGNFLKGVGQSLLGTVKAVGHMVMHPVETVKGVGHMVTHPGQTARAIGSAAKGAYHDFRNGDANIRANMLGKLTGELGQMLVGAGGAKAGVQAARLAKAAKAEGKIAKFAVAAGEKEISVYRVFGGDAAAEGFSWTPKNPGKVRNFRNAAGLPSGGAGRSEMVQF